MQFIDTHVHLNFEVFEEDLDTLQENWKQAGVSHLVHSCVDPKEFKGIQAIANRFSELSFAIGLHPLDAHKWTPQTAQEIFDLARCDHRVVAIGETGLDFYKATNHQQQETCFRTHLDLAHRLQKPLIIHCREAASALRTIIQEYSWESDQPKGVMHCWGGTPEETQWFLDLGFYISFSGIVTFKNATQVQESAKIVPSDRLLIETDCPFLAPTPKRGKRNEPSYVLYVAQKLAQLREEPLEVLAQQTTANAHQLFNLSSNNLAENKKS